MCWFLLVSFVHKFTTRCLQQQRTADSTTEMAAVGFDTRILGGFSTSELPRSTAIPCRNLSPEGQESPKLCPGPDSVSELCTCLYDDYVGNSMSHAGFWHSETLTSQISKTQVGHSWTEYLQLSPSIPPTDTAIPIQDRPRWSLALGLLSTMPKRRLAISSFSYSAAALEHWEASSSLLQDFERPKRFSFRPESARFRNQESSRFIYFMSKMETWCDGIW